MRRENFARLKKFFFLILILVLGLTFYLSFYFKSLSTSFEILNERTENQLGRARRELRSIKEELEAFKNEDQYLINQELEEEVENIQKTYQKAVDEYEDLLDLKALVEKTDRLDALLAESLILLAKRNYASATASLTNLDSQIEKEREEAVASFKIPEDLVATNEPPASGYRWQKVQTEAGAFMVSLITADLNTARVIVDTASESDCHDNCPVLPLAEYVARNGAFAGINGSYFCPATYPSCAGKKNTFDTLLMNKNKVYFNSENNVYSTVPAVIFHSNTVRFVSRSLEWGRDTGVDAVIANHPLLVLGGQVQFGGDADVKKTVRGNRSFVGVTGANVYIGVVHNASVAESARVVHALGIHDALNLDNGGSTALWHGGYKVGPGRDLPNVVLLVKK